eukprot:3609930-Rhodomonas_salina.5
MQQKLTQRIRSREGKRERKADKKEGPKKVQKANSWWEKKCTKVEEECTGKKLQEKETRNTHNNENTNRLRQAKRRECREDHSDSLALWVCGLLPWSLPFVPRTTADVLFSIVAGSNILQSKKCLEIRPRGVSPLLVEHGRRRGKDQGHKAPPAISIQA